MLYAAKSPLSLRFKGVSGIEKEDELDGVIVVRFDSLEDHRMNKIKILIALVVFYCLW